MNTEIDSERQLTIVTLSGPFDIAKVKEMVEQFHQDPNYDPTYNALYDIRKLDITGVTSDQLQRLAFEVFDPSWDGTRFAMVAEDDDVFGMARVYAALADETGRVQRRAFRSMAAAEEWVTG